MGLMHFTACRSVTHRDLGNFSASKALFEVAPSQCRKGTISWPYFVIIDKNNIIFHDPNAPNPLVRHDYL